MFRKNKVFHIAALVCVLTALFIFAVSYYLGKAELFLLLNTDLGRIADYYFKAFTNLGDGILWILIAVFLWKYKRYYLRLCIFIFVLSTVFTQVFKYWIIPDEPRPTKALAGNSDIHVVPDVELHTVSSFPSGHTATAFCFFLLGCLVFNDKRWLYFGFLYALLVGYSRVYLAQHFPFDVAGGIIVALISVYLSLFIFYRTEAKQKAANKVY
jgi:membrane-associated phospholipid phosphatase